MNQMVYPTGMHAPWMPYRPIPVPVPMVPYVWNDGLRGEVQAASSAAVLLNQALRKLWSEHSTYTRLAIDNIVDGSPSTTAVVNRLLQNPSDFAKALAPYYGEQAAAQFEKLLHDHLTLAADLVKAAKAGKTKEAAAIEQKWYTNADDIAAWMARVNPYWSEAEARKLMHEHLDMVKEIAVARLSKQYEKENEVTDLNYQHLLMFADFMTDGLLKQFPQMF